MSNMPSEDVREINELMHKLVIGLQLDILEAYSGIFKNYTLSDFRILRYVLENKDCSLKNIREYIKMPSSTLTSAINRFEKRGLLKRKINPEDYRSFRLELTDKGKQILVEHEKHDVYTAEIIIKALGSKEKSNMFIELLREITSKI